MAAPGKAQMLTEVQTILQKRYKLEPRTDKLTVLESVVYGICHKDTTREQANQALNRFRDQFFDWNEVRVSSIEEIKGVLAGQPDAESRANMLRRFLRQMFEKEYKFEIDALAKKPLRDSIKILEEYEAMSSDYVIATVIQLALGGHAIPVDSSIRRGLERLGILEEGIADDAARSLLERAVPKNRGAEFVDLMEELTHDTCLPGVPDCPRCELRKICPTGQERIAADKVSAKAAAKAGTAAASAPGKGTKAVPPPPPEPPSKSEKPPKGREPRSK